jgi:hypothetical protein
MFGKKNPNIDLNNNNEISTKNIDINPQNEQDNIYGSNKFIFYDFKNKFTSKLEIYISITNYNKKFLMVIDFDSSFEDLKLQITLNLKEHPEFKNIKKLSPEELYKISNSVKADLPLEGKVKDFINSGDIVFCFLNTDEFWIKTYYNIITYNFKKIIKMEYKLKKKMKYKQFKLMLMKGGINFFIDNIKKSDLYDFNYYLKYFEFKIKKHKMIITHNIHNRQKNKMPIDKIINYTSEIIVKLNFGIFEKLIHENLKLSNLENSNILRFNEYADLSFEDLMNERKYLPEFNTIKEIADDFIKEYNKTNNPNFIFYSRRKIKIQKDKLIFSSKKNNNLLEDQKPIDELKEEDEDKYENNLQSIEINRKKTVKSKGKISVINDIINENDVSNIKINDIQNDINEEQKPKKRKIKKEKIKNMIIISKQMVKEEKIRKRYNKLTTLKISEKNKEFSKGIKGKQNLSISNKNLMVYDFNKNNIFNKSEDENKKIKRDNSQETFSDFNINIDNDFKPKSLNEKKGILLFGEGKKNNSREGLDELLLDDSQKENLIFKDKYQTTISTKKTNNLKGAFQFNNPANTEPFEDDPTSSNFDEDNKSDLNTEKAPKIKKIEKVPSFKYNTKRAFFSAFRNRNKNINICEDLKSKFDAEDFIDSIRKYFNNFIDKPTLEKLKMPQSKEIEYLEKEHKLVINPKKDKQNLDIKLGSRFHVHIFMILLLIILVVILLFINLDFLSIYLDI